MGLHSPGGPRGAWCQYESWVACGWWKEGGKGKGNGVYGRIGIML